MSNREIRRRVVTCLSVAESEKKCRLRVNFV